MRVRQTKSSIRRIATAALTEEPPAFMAGDVVEVQKSEELLQMYSLHKEIGARARVVHVRRDEGFPFRIIIRILINDREYCATNTMLKLVGRIQK